MIDWSDPCARAAELRRAYHELVAGEKESVLRSRSNDVEEEVRFHPANLTELKAAIAEAEAACAGRPRPRTVRIYSSKGV